MSDIESSQNHYEDIMTSEDKRPEVVLLFSNLRKELPNLTKLLENCSDHRGYEDVIYRFYHESFKVYRIQDQTLKIVETLKNLLPGRELNKMFLLIVEKGTGMEWSKAVNKHWFEVTRPMLEAFFHARYFLEMAVKYGGDLEYPPNLLPSGWASLLHLYDLR